MVAKILWVVSGVLLCFFLVSCNECYEIFYVVHCYAVSKVFWVVLACLYDVLCFQDVAIQLLKHSKTTEFLESCSC